VNPADKRLSELLDRWLASLELHLRYAGLDDEAYQKVQPWPPHDRPTRWVVELALQKLRQLREHHDARIEMGDVKFADALEQMGFLANLVGAQHIRRFIPLADPKAGPPADNTTEVARAGETTREMARPKTPRGRSATGAHTRPARAAPPADPNPEGRRMVLEDARRLLGWDRKWHELPELIGRMAGRPSVTEVRRILREHKEGLNDGPDEDDTD
jgi:hypothetical protein